MTYDEKDIDFKSLDDSRFEELCFDLLLKLGFHHLSWRRGGADSGRDIEAIFTVTNPLIGDYQELWFVECKNHSSGLGPTDIDSKISWAKAERPSHFLLITSSYITNNTRQWLKDICRDAPFKVHLIEGKILRKVLLNYPRLVSAYFAESAEKLLQRQIEEFRENGTFPNVTQLHLLCKQLNLRKLEIHEVAFLFLCCRMQEEQINRWELDNESFNFDDLEHSLWELANYTGYYSDEIVVEDFYEITGGRMPHAIFKVKRENETNRVFWLTLKSENDSGLEIWLESGVTVSAKVKKSLNDFSAESKKTMSWIETGLKRLRA